MAARMVPKDGKLTDPESLPIWRFLILTAIVRPSLERSGYLDIPSAGIANALGLTSLFTALSQLIFSNAGTKILSCIVAEVVQLNCSTPLFFLLHVARP